MTVDVMDRRTEEGVAEGARCEGHPDGPDRPVGRIEVDKLSSADDADAGRLGGASRNRIQIDSAEDDRSESSRHNASSSPGSGYPSDVESDDDVDDLEDVQEIEEEKEEGEEEEEEEEVDQVGHSIAIVMEEELLFPRKQHTTG